MNCGFGIPVVEPKGMAHPGTTKGTVTRRLGAVLGSTFSTLTVLSPPFVTQSLLWTASKKAEFGAVPTAMFVAIFVEVSITDTEFPAVFSEKTRLPVELTAR